MIELRLAREGETEQQKRIWKLCFGDDDSFIDLFYTSRYKAEDTSLLLCNGEIVSMLTMLPVKVITGAGAKLEATILYAIATHPGHRGKGFAGRLIGYSHELLRKQNRMLSLVVPAQKGLFAFYQRLGFQAFSCLREISLTKTQLSQAGSHTKDTLTVKPAAPEVYNQRRERLLAGNLYVSYRDEEIAYQKKISLYSGADIYTLDNLEIQGCAAVERLRDIVLIKELLLPPDSINAGLNSLARLFPARDFILRLPFFWQQAWGHTRLFALAKDLGQGSSLPDPGDGQGYLGLAFD